MESGRFVEVNDAATKIYGYSQDEMVGKNGLELDIWINPREREPFYSELKNQGQIRNYEVKERRKSGEQFYALVSTEIISIHSNRYLVSIIHDITNHKMAEKALRESEDKYRSIFDNAIIGFYQVTPEGRFLSANNHAARILGYESGEELIRTISDIDTQIYADPDARKIARQIIREKGILENFEVQCRHKDGHLVWVSFTSRLVRDPGGNILYHEGMSQDISKRKELEEQLRASERKYLELFENMSSGVAIFRAVDNGTDFLFIDINPAAERIERINRTDLIGQRITNVLSGVRELGLLDRFHRVWKTGKMEYVPPVLYQNDRIPGAWREGWVFRLPTGEIISIYNDITDRKITELALLKEKEFISQLIETIPDTMFLFDPDTEHPVMWNQALQRISGYSFEEIQNMRLPSDWFSKEDLMKVSEMKKKALQGQYISFEMSLHTKRGELIPTEYSATVLPDYYEKGPLILAIGHDISERKKVDAELEKLRILLSEGQKIAQIGSFEYIINTHEMIWSEEEFRIYGLEPYTRSPTYEEMITTYIHPDDVDMLDKTFKNALQTGSTFDMEYKIINPDKTVRIIKSRALPYYGEQGNLVKYIGITHDITELKQAEQALLQSNQKLNLLTSLTRHDILNLLSVIDGSLTIAIDSKNTDNLFKYINYAKDAGKRIADIIGFTEEYQDFGIISSGWHNVVQLIESVRKEILLGSITIDIQIPSSLEIYGDPIIRKVFSTLLQNAVRHGQIITNIHFFITKSHDALIITCSDNGIGIPPEKKELIFNHGYGEHTAVGLFIAREILSITGLTIKECGIEGDGATFEILIPAGKWRNILD
jgi:PAS domain S-box-containing protein